MEHVDAIQMMGHIGRHAGHAVNLLQIAKSLPSAEQASTQLTGAVPCQKKPSASHSLFSHSNAQGQCLAEFVGEEGPQTHRRLHLWRADALA